MSITLARSAAVDDDGLPVHAYAAGDPLVPGVQAWRRLAVGTRCEAWLGWSHRIWAPVVVKLPRPHQADHPRARESLRREVGALAGTLHPTLPRLYADDLDADLPYLVEEYVDGPALDELPTFRRLPAAAIAELGAQLLGALVPLHARGLAHLDIKPANVVLADGRPVLIDFGSARRIGSLQPAGHPVGTLGYASPEMEACAPISAAMDVYGVGATLAELWGRRRPYGPRGHRVDELVRALTAPDADHRPDLPVALALAAACLPADPPWPDWVDSSNLPPVA